MRKGSLKSFFLGILTVALLSGCAGVDRTETYSRPHKPSLSIKNVHDLSESFIREISSSADTKDVFFLVHPSYYIFFHENPFYLTPGGPKNAVQTFIESSLSETSPIVRLMKDYEQKEMEFIASAGNNKKIVILILPGNYQNAKQFRYRNEVDEYARYINESSGTSTTVFYIESTHSTTGKIDPYDQKALVNFLKKIDAQRIFLGGGYIGRCQEEFYKFLMEVWPEEKLAIIPEISAFSPNDISDSTAQMLMNAENRLDPRAAKYFLKNGGLESLSKKINIGSIFLRNSDN